MKALVKAKAEPGFWLDDVPDPVAGPGDVLVRVLRSGICGTDLHIHGWDDWARSMITPPLVVGHEFVGEVIEVGLGVNTIRPGEVVSGEGHVVCGRCRSCLAGRRHLCPHTEGMGVQRPGAFAEFVVVPATNLWRQPDEADLDVAAIFDPFGNAVHTALQFPVLGEDVLITGAGPIGIMAALVAQHAGARHVVLTDVNDYRLDLAGRAGVRHAVDVGEVSLAEVQRELGMQEGFDVGLEVSGSGQALRAMIDNMFHGGRIAMLGLPSGETTIDWSDVVLRMLTVKGIHGREMFETWYAMSVLIEAGLDISRVITHRYSFRDYEEAFATAQSGQCGKVILDWTC